MTREEELKEARHEWYLRTQDADFCAGFQKGAEWADRTMIDKACEWLRTNLCEHYAEEPFAHKMGMQISGYISFFENPPVGVINDFRKAMGGDEQ